MPRKQLKAEELEKKIDLIIDLEETLEQVSLGELKTYARGLVSGYSRLKKTKLIVKLKEAIEPKKKRLEVLSYLNKAGESSFDMFTVQEYYKENKSPKETAKILYAMVKRDDHTDSTISKTDRKRLDNILKELTFSNRIDSNWGNEVYKYFKEETVFHSRKTNLETRDKVESYGTDAITIEGERVLKWSEETLKKAASKEGKLKGKEWHLTSLALSLTSGRRMDEIHGTCEFYPSETKGNILSVGLSKKKKDDEKLDSLCLVNPELWLKAYDNIPDQYKGCDNATVHNNIRKLMEKNQKEVLESFGLNSYKDARDFYISYSISKIYLPNRSKIGASQTAFIKKIVGHESKLVSNSYEKFVVL